MDEARNLFPPPEYDLRLFPFPKRKGVRAKLETFLQPYSYMFSAELRSDLETELAKGFDVLHLEQLWTGWLGLAHRDQALVNVLQLYRIDLADLPPRGVVGRLRRSQLLRAERRLLRAYAHLLSLSYRLRSEIRTINHSADVSVVPIGIDVTLYQYIPDDVRTTDPVVSVIGNMNWQPTHSAAVRLVTRLWPEIKKRVPEAQLQLVGWGARRALADYLSLPDVTVIENVPDTRLYFECSGVLLYAPGRGSGMKVKVLEALGYGVPVVTTSEGIEGLPAVDGIHAGVCEDDAGLIQRTVALLQDPAAQNRQRAAGRSLLEEHCGPKPTVDAIEAVYASVVGNRKSVLR
jgi:glycosyltransferase involved in cell wall biosynthesis